MRPEDPRQRVALHEALTDPARQHRLIEPRNDLASSRYRAVQEEVVEATPRAEYGIPVTFSDRDPIRVVLRDALAEAGTRVHEPVLRVHLVSRTIWSVPCSPFRVPPRTRQGRGTRS